MPRCRKRGTTILLAVFFASLLAGGRAVMADAPLTIVTWGGAYEAAQRRALFTPFSEASGRAVRVLAYKGTLDELAARAGAEDWDVVDMIEDEAIKACKKGLLHPLDHERILTEEGGVSIQEDFAPLRLSPCAIPQNVYAQVLAYDDDAFSGVKPRRVEDFFDIDRFPGKRAVQKTPDGLLEWALLAEGVPQRQVYDLLSTDRGLWIAFRKLETIRDAIVWWDDPAEPAALLEKGAATMASGYNGRFFSAAQTRKAPVVIIWDGQLIGYDVWAAPKGADIEAACDFLRFATRSARMADLAELIPYGPARTSALEQIGLHPDTTAPMREYLPNARMSSGRYLIRDSDWYANTHALRMRRFRAWLEKGANHRTPSNPKTAPPGPAPPPHSADSPDGATDTAASGF
jgi:putative spermidine/putrescine transport system substrate-binding protein